MVICFRTMGFLQHIKTAFCQLNFRLCLHLRLPIPWSLEILSFVHHRDSLLYLSANVYQHSSFLIIVYPIVSNRYTVAHCFCVHINEDNIIIIVNVFQYSNNYDLTIVTSWNCLDPLFDIFTLKPKPAALDCAHAPLPLYTREMGGQLGSSYLIAQWTYTCTQHTHTRTHERALIIHFIRMPPTNMPPVINMTQSGTTTSLRRGLLIVLQYFITDWAWSSCAPNTLCAPFILDRLCNGNGPSLNQDLWWLCEQ